LQFGHRSPSGRIQQNTTVAAMIRSTKNDTNTIAKIAASDMLPSPLPLLFVTPLHYARRGATIIPGAHPCRWHAL
jgi:hypothetical protein